MILTGEALRRRNAEAIAGVLAERGGELVTATAGHNMEAMLAAYGSGAAKASYDTGRRILNVDIGGGTTKLAVLDRGQVVTTAAVHIGGRLQVVDDRRPHRPPRPRRAATTPPAPGIAGSSATSRAADEIEKVAETMADALVAALTADPLPAGRRAAVPHRTAGEAGPIDGVMFSGGVAEYVYDRESGGSATSAGRSAGRCAAGSTPARCPSRCCRPGECIRATALGASEYSVQLSGNTGCITDPDALLPRRNLQVVRPAYELGETVDAAAVADGDPAPPRRP